MTTTASAQITYSFPVPDLSDDGLAKVTAQVADSAAEYDCSGEIPWKGLEAIYRAGLITASIAPEHGGPGITARDAARAVAAVGEGDPSVAIILANTLLTHGTIAAVPWQGFGVFCAWTAVLLVACGWLLVRRDA
jgi:alkylation response protein AidB-like acyl-CoA dehydrogenase